METNRGSALNGGPDDIHGVTGVLKVMGSSYQDARAISTTIWDVQA